MIGETLYYIKKRLKILFFYVFIINLRFYDNKYKTVQATLVRITKNARTILFSQNHGLN